MTNERILRSQRMRTASKTVSDNIQLLLQRAAETLTNQWNAVNAAFTVRIKEYMEAKDRLQTHLSEVRFLNKPSWLFGDDFLPAGLYQL